MTPAEIPECRHEVLTAGERIALVAAVVPCSRIPGKARLLAALDRVRKECPPIPKEGE